MDDPYSALVGATLVRQANASKLPSNSTEIAHIINCVKRTMCARLPLHSSKSLILSKDPARTRTLPPPFSSC